ncbi:hypothetical protein Leryth_024281 [Lithospermum erythrorhizon]|nr:hypothetical protein Leryth_024281 [Lithospermum erythrorhizon]
MITTSPIFFSIFFCLIFLLQLTTSTDTLSPNQSLIDGQILTSEGQRFHLGFFSPNNSNLKRYLGIWYKTTPDVIVWVANSRTPLQDSSGTLTFTKNGTLILENATHGVLWASSKPSHELESPILKLLDTGNLIIQEKTTYDDSVTTTTSFPWQSFDYPGNTRLPGMLLGENTETGKEIQITSWISPDDPSPGDFTYKIDQLGLSQLTISNGTRKRFRTGPFNGICFNGLLMVGNQTFRILTDVDRIRVRYITDPYNASSINRLVLAQNGTIQRYVLDQKTNEWKHSFTIPGNVCDIYGQCGKNGICNPEQEPICKCFDGTKPVSDQEWVSSDWSKGCRRDVSEDCGNVETFVKISGAKLPDLLRFEMKKNMNLRCLMWFGDLVDVRKYPEENNEQSFYARVPISKQGNFSVSGKNNKKKVLITIAISVVGLLTTMMICGCIVVKIKKIRGQKSKKEDLELPLFEFSTIVAATKNFSSANMIGEGGFGAVYKGELSKKQEVAVKRLSKHSGQGIEEFKNEVNLIAKLQHRNLVRLLGCCIQGEERILIYEYMENNCLDHFIFGPSKKQLLPWPKRFDIIMGIARGLLYLHQDSRLKIIHRDLKTSNILLDSNLIPKISDFGLARTFDLDQASAKTKRVVGTYGYMAPEYAIDGKFSIKSDVFSMGVLILEIVAGKKNRSFSHPDHHHNLAGHAWLLWNDERDMELMDGNMKDSYVEKQVRRCIQVGLLCVQKLVDDRPEMSSVLFMLSNEEAKLEEPKEPGFFVERSSFHDEEKIHIFGSEEYMTKDTMTIY